MERCAHPPDNCQWCGFPLSHGTHGVIKGGVEGESVGVQCRVPMKIATENMPIMDVLFGTAHVTSKETPD